MANKDHVEILKKGVLEWNDWREDNPGLEPDLSDVTIRFAENIRTSDGTALPPLNYSGVLKNSDGNSITDCPIFFSLEGINLKNTNLCGSTLNDLTLKGAKFRGANLQNTKISNTDLSGADLKKAVMRNSYIKDTNLSQSNLSGTDQSYARMKRVQLGNVAWMELDHKLKDTKRYLIINRAILKHIELSDINLENVNFGHVRLSQDVIENFELYNDKVTGWNVDDLIDINCNTKEVRLTAAGLEVVDNDFRGIDMSGAELINIDLKNASLTHINLNNAKLEKVNFSGANISGADFGKARLVEVNIDSAISDRANYKGATIISCDLTGVDFSEINLSGVTIDETTLKKTDKVKGGELGVNGIWADNDSAALFPMNPPGNSMLGHNSNAVLESLKRARRLHGISMSFLGIFILMALFKIPEIEISQVKGAKLSISEFGLLAMAISAGLLTIANNFIKDALRGARYINNRESVMMVGNFPWSISRYAGQVGYNMKLSFAIRLIMSFHPIAYPIVYLIHFLSISTGNMVIESSYIPILAVSTVLLFLLGSWTFLNSQDFQKPIIFDQKTEESREDDTDKIVNAIKYQTNMIMELVEKTKSLHVVEKAKD